MRVFPFWREEFKSIYDRFWCPTFLQSRSLISQPYNGPPELQSRQRNWFTTEVFETKLNTNVPLDHVAKFLYRYCDHPGWNTEVKANEKKRQIKVEPKTKKKPKTDAIPTDKEWVREIISQETKLPFEDQFFAYKEGLDVLKQARKEKAQQRTQDKKRQLDESFAENPDVYQIHQLQTQQESQEFLAEQQQNYDDIKKKRQQKREQKTARNTKKQKVNVNDKQSDDKQTKTIGIKRKRTSTKTVSMSTSDIQINKLPANSASKIALFLSMKQKSIVRQWMGGSRWIYNQCVILVRHKLHQPSEASLRLSFKNERAVSNMVQRLRKKNLFRDKKDADKKQYDASWLFQIPAKIRDQAIRDFVHNFKSAAASLQAIKEKAQEGCKSPSQSHSHFKFRSLKDKQQSIVLPCQDWGQKTKDDNPLGLGHLANERNLCASSIQEDFKIPKKLLYDSRLTRTRLGKYFLCIPSHKPNIYERWKTDGKVTALMEAKEPHSIISLDPGVRTFLTGYDPSGKLFQWGHKDMSRVCKLAKHYDQLQSKISKAKNHGSRYRMRKAANRIQLRIRNLVDEVHKKLALFLVKNYQIVILPHFNAKDMVKRFARRISSKVVRQMLTWSHFRFRLRLLHKQTEYPWCRVIVTDEAYTSKTCGKCGLIHQKLGGNKIFKCPHCGSRCERDIHAARNIFLRLLSKILVQPNTMELFLASC